MKKYFLAGIGAIFIAVALVFSWNSEAKSSDKNVTNFTVASYNLVEFYL